MHHKRKCQLPHTRERQKRERAQRRRRKIVMTTAREMEGNEQKPEELGGWQSESAGSVWSEVWESDEKEERQREWRGERENKGLVTEGIHPWASVNQPTLSSITSACRGALFYWLRHRDGSPCARTHTHTRTCLQSTLALAHTDPMVLKIKRPTEDMQCKWSEEKTTGVFVCNSAMWRVARPIAHYTEFNKNERWSRMSDTRLKYKERRKQENKGIIQGEQGDGVSWSRTERSPRALSPRPSWSSISLRATKHSNILKPVRLWTTTTKKKNLSCTIWQFPSQKKSVPGCHDNRDGTPQLKSLMMSGCWSPRVHMCRCLARQLVRMKIII